jgi:hypothetical protein
MTRAEVAQLYTPIYDEFMLQEYGEETQVHPKIFQIIEDSTKEYKTDGLSGLGEWVDADEDTDGGLETPVQGYAKTFTQTKFWKKFYATFEAVDQDEYALLKKEGEARSMGRGARAKIEKDCAAVLYAGFATGTSPDGQYLWDTDHDKSTEETSVHYDNLLSGALSHDNLEAAEKQIADHFKDPAGIPIPQPERPLLVYPPALRGKVMRLLSDRANEQPDTALRNINRFAGKYEAVEWRYLSADMGGSDTAWYIIFKEMNMLKVIWSAKPSFSAWIDEQLERYWFKGRMLNDCGATDWRCGFASTGV